LLALFARYWSRQVSLRALPAESFEYLESTAFGNTAFDAVADDGDVAGAAALGAALAPEPHCA
jgi:hypothetical protein